MCERAWSESRLEGSEGLGESYGLLYVVVVLEWLRPTVTRTVAAINDGLLNNTLSSFPHVLVDTTLLICFFFSTAV